MIILVCWRLSALLQFVVILRLLQLRLVRTYLWLTVWMVVEVVSFLVLSKLIGNIDLFYRGYVWSMIAIALCECAITWEAFSLRCAHYGGVRLFGRRLLLALVLVGCVVCLFVLRAQFMVGDWPKIAAPVTVTKNIVNTILAVFLMLSEITFGMVFKPAVPRNVLIYGRAFTVLMLLNSIAYLVQNVTGGKSGPYISVAVSVFPCLFSGALLLGMRRAGEEAPPEPPPSAGDIMQIRTETNALMRFFSNLKSIALGPL